MKPLLLPFALIPLALLAQNVLAPASDPKTSATGPVAIMAPTISSEQRAAFWRAAAEFNQIKPIYERAQEKMQAAVAQLEKACGEMAFGSNAAGEPACIDKPKK